ncbi:50S ribosomal protein L33 [Candidatus Beckwithbacteria bacterium RBG_13_42_9]|uniref:Large ribosomal subunit protein bL33 n=1 Tax=Candidatus Beckwithbacteria bacterium RBG_13_42_9 TaxID=1797457 RepID=A0A1F5E701_9BACT|nr:MAG: 50S ribosomal protein L33 [Candidatus Beckwithbacteria bacterium RBG_13_42_9]
MAKKGPRILIALICTICGSQNYITEKNKANAQLKEQGKLVISKYCKRCKKHTPHKETTKLK